MSKKLVKIESFAELAKTIEESGGGLVIKKKDGINIINSFHFCIAHFNNGYQYIEIEQPKTDREKCADLITQNEYICINGAYEKTDNMRIAHDCVLCLSNFYAFGVFIEKAKPATKEERNKSLYGESQ